MSDLIPRLARSCARGERQELFINELLAGPVEGELFEIPGQFGATTMRYGQCKLPTSSWRNLRIRLIRQGFFFVTTDSSANRTVEMKFSQ